MTSSPRGAVGSRTDTCIDGSYHCKHDSRAMPELATDEPIETIARSDLLSPLNRTKVLTLASLHRRYRRKTFGARMQAAAGSGAPRHFKRDRPASRAHRHHVAADEKQTRPADRRGSEGKESKTGRLGSNREEPNVREIDALQIGAAFPLLSEILSLLTPQTFPVRFLADFGGKSLRHRRFSHSRRPEPA